MTKANPLTVAVLLGALTAILFGAIAANAGAPVGSTFPIRAEAEQELEPAVAYNSQAQEYLVVFWNDRPGNDDIRAERVSRHGKLLGGTWISAGVGYDRRHPDVAYNSQTNQYLVVWQHYYQAVGAYAIHGRLLSATGQVVGTSDIIIRGLSVAAPNYPAVAYASTTNKYLVVWQEEYSSPPNVWVDIVGQVVNSDGTLSGNDFDISSDPGGQERGWPVLAYNRHANEYLVVWQQWGGIATDWDIYARRVQGDGTPMFPTSIEIRKTSAPQAAAAIAAIPTAPGPLKYLVLWNEWGGTSWDIHLRMVEEDGSPHPQVWVVANGPEQEYLPAVAGTEYGHQYLVTWRLDRGTLDVPILAWNLSYEGAFMGDPVELSGAAATDPAVATGPLGSFLVTWQDQPAGTVDTNIYGHLWGNRVYLPLAVRH